MVRYVPLLASLLIWSWSGVLIKYLQTRFGFDPYSQNAYRYMASAVVMLSVASLVDRKGLRRAFSSRWFFITGLMGATYQTAWVVGLYFVYPTFASLIGRSSMIFTVLIGVLFFPDERRLAGNPRFLAALTVAMLGVVGVILFHPAMEGKGTEVRVEASAEGDGAGRSGAVSTEEAAVDRKSLVIGSALIILGSGMWVAYVYGAKILTRCSSPIASFSAANSVTALMLLAVASVLHLSGKADMGRVMDVGWFGLFVLFGSGVLCVGIAQSIYYLSVKWVGVAFSQTVSLVSPLLVGVNSWLIFGEDLTLLQWVSGMVLLAALGYILSLENRMRRIEEGASLHA